MAIKNITEIKLILEKNKELQKTFINYFLIKERIKTFNNLCNEKTFNNLFKEHSKRLWNNYIQQCDRNFDKFLTYLTYDQKTVLIYNIYEVDFNMYN